MTLKYTFLEKLHDGKHCLVFKGVRDLDQKPVISKMLKDEHPSAMLRAQMLHEYAILQKLATPRVVKAYALEEAENKTLLVMEDFGGKPLSALIQSRQIDLKVLFHFGIQLAQGLGEIHHSHISHKDIKPQNIIANVTSGQVKIIDFGIATILSREVQQIANPQILEGTLVHCQVRIDVFSRAKAPGLSDRKWVNIRRYGPICDRSTSGAFAQAKHINSTLTVY